MPAFHRDLAHIKPPKPSGRIIPYAGTYLEVE
ncbi:MAG: hypothetical protein HW391_1188, partial [Chloroflexi bacterium]|nr:hypothetical protein [Chloroflexota bacterium]